AGLAETPAAVALATQVVEAIRLAHASPQLTRSAIAVRAAATVDARAVGAVLAGRALHARAGIHDAGAAHAHLVGGARDARAGVRRQAEEVARGQIGRAS